MAVQEPIDKLEAVNTMLRLLGERKVNSLTDPTRLDVISAIDALDEITKRVQFTGWWFNRRVDQDLIPQAGEYLIPDHWLTVDESYNWGLAKFTYRGGKLFNLRTGLTDGHVDTLKVDYLEEVIFDELPQSARHAIAAQAAVLFTTERIGSREMLRELRENAEQTFADLLTEEIRHSGLNLQRQPENQRVLREHSR